MAVKKKTSTGGTQSTLEFPSFVSTITKRCARRQRWRHTLTSWMGVPFRMLLGRAVQSEDFGILMYHRVCPSPKGHFTPTYSVTPEAFADQLDWLLSHGYRAWSLQQLVEARRTNKPIDDKVFAVTFDDAYGNVATYALPVLQEFRVPATVFLATAYLDRTDPFPFDNWIGERPDHVSPETWLPITRDQCRAMLDSGLVDLGAHSHTHADFRGRPEDFEADLKQCMEVLSHDFGVHQPAFSYPFGDPLLGFASPELGTIAQQCGCSCALQIGNSVVHRNDDPFHWPRFDVAFRDSGASLAAKLDGWSEVLRASARRIRGTAP